jgi:cytochrome c-type biogenesis protein CcmH
MIRLIAALLMVVSSAVWAIEPGTALSDPEDEARARALMSEIRCLVCQAESVEASPSPFAREVRGLIREQVASGRSNDQIKVFLADRYGEEILYRPPLKASTWLLWLGPFVVLIIGAGVVVLVVRSARGEPAPADALSEEERAALRAALDKDPPHTPS